MVKRYLLILLCLLAIPAAAQTFYEFSYDDPDDDETYLGLMIYYDDENCKVRIVSDELYQKDEVLESNYVQAVDGKKGRNDVGVMMYCPEEEGFPILMWVWERDDASDINEKPYCTFDAGDEDSYFEVEYFKEITLSMMDEKYVRQFYGEDEPEFAMLMRGIQQMEHVGTGTFTPFVPNQQSTIQQPTDTPSLPVGGRSTFHLVIVANTEVSDIGVACKRDMNNLRGEFSGIARALGMEYEEIIVAENDFNKANLVKAVRGVKAGANDVLMFVYTGHGFRFDDQKDYYPNVDLRATNYDNPQKNYAAMTDIYNELSSKGARLTIVLSDCCNALIGVEAPMSNVNSLFSRANTNFDLAKLSQLFLGSSGSIKATASSPGEVSWCGVNGGFFILSFLESLRSQISPLHNVTPSWEGLLRSAMVLAKNKTKASANAKEQNGLLQVKTKDVKFTTPQTEKESDGYNVAPGAGGSTLDL